MKRIGVVGIENGWSSQRLVDAFGERGFAARLVEMGRVVSDLQAGRVDYLDADLGGFDALVIKKMGAKYSPLLFDRLSTLCYLAHRGVRIFSDPRRIKGVLDRLSCTLALRSAGIPMPPTIITESAAAAAEAIRGFGRAVLKPLYTSKARGMCVVEDGPNVEEAIQRYRKAGHRTLYIQKMVKLPGRDLGLAFLGGRYLGCYARVGQSGSWNTTTHSGGRYEPYDPSDELIALAHRAQAPFELDFTSVDLAETDNGPIVFEVSAFGGFRGLWEARSVSAADLYADYVLEKVHHAR